MHPNYPNPFNAATRVAYSLSPGAATRVRLGVYTILGQEVRSLVDAPQQGGTYQTDWDGRDGHGRRQASGVYLLRLRIPGKQWTRRMLLLR